MFGFLKKIVTFKILFSGFIGVLIVGFPIVIPLRGIPCNCAEMRATVLELRATVLELRASVRNCNCAQVKSTCVENPS